MRSGSADWKKCFVLIHLLTWITLHWLCWEEETKQIQGWKMKLSLDYFFASSYQHHRLYVWTPQSIITQLFITLKFQVKFDLVVCAHTLLELPSAETRLQTVLSLWHKTSDYLVFVEHGSRASYNILMEVRDFLFSLSEGDEQPNLHGHVFAPVKSNEDH